MVPTPMLDDTRVTQSILTSIQSSVPTHQDGGSARILSFLITSFLPWAPLAQNFLITQGPYRHKSPPLTNMRTNRHSSTQA